jgi:hypothetical protein
MIYHMPHGDMRSLTLPPFSGMPVIVKAINALSSGSVAGDDLRVIYGA